ncbi:MAG: septum formation initiator family protein [Gemmatimonadota bacterium]
MSRRVWIVLAGVVAAAVFALSGGEYSLWQWVALTRELSAERALVADLRRQVDSLGRVAKLVETDLDTQERIAREKHGLLRPGEHVYRVVTPTEP